MMDVRLPYVANFTIATDGTTQFVKGLYTYYSNNMYDPQIQLGGHQPFQFDQCSMLYQNYVVRYTEVKLTFSNPSADGVWVGYRVRAPGTLATYNNPLSYVKEMANTDARPLNDTGSQTTVFKFAFDTVKLIGQFESAKGNPSYIGSMSGAFNPVTWCEIDPFACSTVTGADSTVQCMVEITYHARLFERITLPRS
jgi:hypothetical protein